MPSQLENELYVKARERAINRHTSYWEMYTESTRAFEAALSTAYPVEDHEDVFGVEERFLKSLVSESNQAFAGVCAFLAKVEAVKGKGYLASWQRKGLLGSILPNLQRKMDRIDNILSLNSEDGGESATENLADLAVYSIKTIDLLAEMRPHEVLAWIRGVRGLK